MSLSNRVSRRAIYIGLYSFSLLVAVSVSTSYGGISAHPHLVSEAEEKPNQPALATELGSGPFVRIESAERSAASNGATQHPHLFFTAEDISALRTKAATTHQEIWQPINDYADSQVGTLPPVSAPPDGNLEAYRTFGHQLIPLALACVISEKVEHCNLAKTYLLTYASWDQWGENNWRDLGHAHMLLGNALAYDWLYPQLSPAERQTVRTSLANWAQKMFEASAAESDQSAWNNWWRQSYLQNHFWINNSAMGLAGLALLGEDERAQGWIDQASSQMTRVQYLLNGIQDGTWHESIPYQNYALTMSLPFMLNLRNIQGNDILPHQYLRNYPYWRLYNLLPGSRDFILAYGNFEWNWSNDYGPLGLLRFTAKEYGNGYAEWTAQQIVAVWGREAQVYTAPWYVFEFFYYEPSIPALAPTSLSQARTFPDLEGVIWRTGWGENDLVFGLKTGPYGGRFGFDTFSQQLYPWACSSLGCQMNIGHDHRDSNGFYLYRAGHWLAPETVAYDGSETALHNTLLIDDQNQFRPVDWRDPAEFSGSDAFLETTASTPNFNYVAADATQRYKNMDGVEAILRQVVFVRPDYLLMVDSVEAETAHEYEWVSHFGESVSVEGDWVRGDAGHGQILGVGVVAPQTFETSVGNDGQPFVRIRPSSPVDDVRFINLLYPTDQDSWGMRPDAIILADSEEAAVLRVQMADGSERTDDILLTYAQPVTVTTAGPYSYDGRVATVSQGGDGGLERVFVFDGTFLTDQTMQRSLVSNLGSTGPFEAIYADGTVYVHGNELTGAMLYAPRAEKLILNGVPWTFIRSGDYIVIAEEPLPLKPIYLPITTKEVLLLVPSIMARLERNVALRWTK